MKLPKKIFQNKEIAIALICIGVIGGFVLFAKNYYLPIPFDSNHMSVETYKVTAITNEYGHTSWKNVDRLRNLIPVGSKKAVDAVKLVYHGINSISGNVVSRTINRGGEEIRVFYYCYEESLWNLWFDDPELRRGSMQQYIYRGSGEPVDYDKRCIEVYYLKTKNIKKLERLSDQEYDGQRERAALIFSGTY